MGETKIPLSCGVTLDTTASTRPAGIATEAASFGPLAVAVKLKHEFAAVMGCDPVDTVASPITWLIPEAIAGAPANETLVHRPELGAGTGPSNRQDTVDATPSVTQAISRGFVAPPCGQKAQ